MSHCRPFHFLARRRLVPFSARERGGRRARCERGGDGDSMFVTGCNSKYVTTGAASHGARPYRNYMCTDRSSNCESYKEQISESLGSELVSEEASFQKANASPKRPSSGNDVSILKYIHVATLYINAVVGNTQDFQQCSNICISTQSLSIPYTQTSAYPENNCG